MTESSRPKRRQAAEASRNRLLEAGLELLAAGLVSPVDEVRGVDVARAAGLTTGAFYHHWKSQADYRNDLRTYITYQGQLDERLAWMAGAFGDDGIHLDAATVKALAGAEVRRLASDPTWHIELSMTVSGSDEDAQAMAQETHMWIAETSEFYAEVMRIAGLRLRPGASIEWFSRSLMALVEGYAIQERAGVPCSSENPAEWGDLEYAIAVLLSATLVPVDAADPDAGVVDELEALLSSRSS